MNNRFLSSILILAASCVAMAQEVTSSVAIEGSVTWVKEADHPGILGKCWESPRETSSSSSKSSAGSIVNEGVLRVDVGVDGKNIKSVVPLEYSWSSKYGEDEVFRVRIGRAATTAASSDGYSDACTRYTWKYKVDSLQTSLSTKLKLKIPAHVWLLKLKFPGGLVPSGFSVGTKGIFELEPKIPKEGSGKLTASSFVASDSYYVVQPGTEVTLSASLNDSGLVSVESALEMEVTLVGESRCAAGASYGPLSKDALGKAVVDMTTDETKAQRGLEYLLCASSGESVRRLIYGENAPVLLDLLQALDRAHTQVINWNTPVAKSTLAASAMSIESALFSVAYNIAENLILYCSEMNVLDFASGQYSGKEKLHRRAQLVFDQARYYLSLAAPRYTHELASELDLWSKEHKRYSDLSLDSTTRSRLDSLFRFYHADTRSFVADQISKWLGDLPDDAFTSPSRTKMYEDLQRLKRVQLELDDEIVLQLRLFYRSAGEPVDAARLSRLDKELSETVAVLEATLSRLESTYGAGGFSNAFLETAINLTEGFYAPFRDIASGRAGGVILTAIQSSGASKVDSENLLKGLRQCVRID